MPEEVKEIELEKIMKEVLFNTVYFGGVVNFDEYKEFMTQEEFDEIVKKAEHQANIHEESWDFNE